MKVTKKVIEAVLYRCGFMFGYDYANRKTIIVNEKKWSLAIELLNKAGIPYKIIREAKSPCTGEISFKEQKQEVK